MGLLRLTKQGQAFLGRVRVFRHATSLAVFKLYFLQELFKVKEVLASKGPPMVPAYSPGTAGISSFGDFLSNGPRRCVVISCSFLLVFVRCFPPGLQICLRYRLARLCHCRGHPGKQRIKTFNRGTVSRRI